MHRYASQTPEARELAVELEFVWDQIKSNPSSSSSSPIQPASIPSLPQHSYPSITGRLARNDYVDHMIARNGMGGDSRLRVLSPVSQPDGHYRGRRADSDIDGDEDDAEEFAEARDQFYDDNEDDDGDGDGDDDDLSTRQEKSVSDDEMEKVGVDYDDERSRESSLRRRGRRDNRHREAAAARSSSDGKPRDTRKWRRRVEQALTKMTAEIAAVREQMEVRDLARRRRSKIWAWLKWIVWVALRQVIWDLAILSMLLIYMRLRGDRRVEGKLRLGWSEVKTRLSKLRSIRRSPRTPLLP
ncbi:Acyl CoA binding protein [Aspergillus sp. HF37]|nr:Acyl CoA binding protein [Aspergillus sp. HF37]